jgi:hypothetical protein
MAHFQVSLEQKRKCTVWRFSREFSRGTALVAQDFQPTFEKESARKIFSKIQSRNCHLQL